MAIAIALLLIVIGSVIFHIVTPWWLTPLASNWDSMDLTIDITMWVTGFFFVAINLFVVYCLWRFRHRAGLKASYQHENKRLEHWLIGVTTVGIIALLAPGLVVYANYVNPPSDSMEVEVLGQQWQWRYRFPGPDGKFGRSDARFVDAKNPFGIDPADPDAQDDMLVDGNELQLPLKRPVKVVLRSHDVLHDYFVPQFRARLNIVPGQVGWFWFMPTKPGRYEAMCAQLCGVGHSNMRGYVKVIDEAGFAAWRGTLPTFATSMDPAAAAPGGDLLARGRALSASKGCVACHSIDGKPGIGPTWKDLFGKTETMESGAKELVDDAFLRGFIKDPKARDVKGFPNVMPQVPVTDEELDALVAYIKSLGKPPAKP